MELSELDKLHNEWLLDQITEKYRDQGKVFSEESRERMREVFKELDMEIMEDNMNRIYR